MPADIETFRRIHAASRLNYKFPDLNSPLFIAKTVVVRDGVPTTLLAGRIETEAYLMTSGTAAERLDDIAEAQSDFLATLWDQGIDNAYCSVPKAVERHFAKHMKRLGWERGRDGWAQWHRDTI